MWRLCSKDTLGRLKSIDRRKGSFRVAAGDRRYSEDQSMNARLNDAYKPHAWSGVISLYPSFATLTRNAPVLRCVGNDIIEQCAHIVEPVQFHVRGAELLVHGLIKAVRLLAEERSTRIEYSRTSVGMSAGVRLQRRIVPLALCKFHQGPLQMWEHLWCQLERFAILSRKINAITHLNGDPNGTRTRVFAVKGRRPRPLDDGAIGG